MYKRQVKTSDTHPIYIDFLNKKWGGQAKLGITIALGKQQPNGMTASWKRDLAKDIEHIKKQYGIQALVSLLQPHQLQQFKIPHQIEECNSRGIKAYHFPVVDQYIPKDQEGYKKLVKRIVDDHLMKGNNVVVHCLGGLGRAPTFAASCLIYGGMNSEEAISAVRSARKHSLTSSDQLNFLKKLSFK